MKKIMLIVLGIFTAMHCYGWGQIGHRTVGHIAQQHLTNKAKDKLHELLKHESLAIVSTWMDEERSNPDYDHTHDWHWVTIPDSLSYEQTNKNPNGDIIGTINRLIAELKKGDINTEQQAIHVKMLVHLIGDIHMPLHVGNGEDRGGNQLKVKWFWENTNLHAVWDYKIIDSKQFSYTELAAAIDHVDDASIIEQWQSDDIMIWVKESKELRNQVYELPEDNNLRYEYQYKNWPTVQLRLHQAGIRLAGVLNDIFQ